MSMALTHRPVAEHDLERICDWPQTAEELFFCFPKATFPLTIAQLRTAIEARSDSTVVERDREVLAFANFYRWQTGSSCAIGNVMVAPAARGTGVGNYLMMQMIDLAFVKHQATEVTVSCFNQNLAGLLFYPKLGFEPYAIEARKNHIGHPVALLHMRRLRNANSA